MLYPESNAQILRLRKMDLLAAVPLVVDTLQQAASQDANVLKPAEQKLKEWETKPGFYSVLLNIISNHTLDLNVRWLAVLFFKNGVDRYWRKNAPNGIQEDEKANLRVGLMATFREPINQVATQLAVLISKAARFDCPREWPELMPHLLNTVRSEDPLIQQRGLLTLHLVIKTLASKRLAGDRRLFHELTANVYVFVVNIWNSYLDNFFIEVQNNNPQCQATLEKALLSLRILRKLTIHGFQKPHESQDVVLFLSNVFDRAKNMLLVRKSMDKSGLFVEMLEKFIVHLTKVHLSLLEHHPFSYVGMIRPALEFTVTFIFTPQPDGLLFERFIIQCLNLIKGIILCAEYKPAKNPEDTREPATLEAHRIKSEFFQADTVSEICRKLVTKYFLLTRDDLEAWSNDPEGFVSEEVGESWKYSLRPCTESVYLSLFVESRDVLIPVLLELIQSNHQIVDPEDIEGILRKDAVYHAVGLSAFYLYDEVDFDQWFTSTLTQELQIKVTNYRVIRRRVAWLIGQWCGVKFSSQLRPALYDALMPLLKGDEDMAIRLTTALALKYAIDDFEFNAEQFLQYLEPTFSLLFNLLKECKECDCKMQVLYVLSFIIERVGSAINPYATSLVQYLPLLWEESAEHNMLRCAIVSTLVAFARHGVNDLLLFFLVPVIQLSTDLQQDAHVYLLEDGLELWRAALENIETPQPDVIRLFQNMPPLLGYSSDYFPLCFHIIQAYLLLAPQPFLDEYGPSLFSTCMELLVDMRSESIILVMKMFELAIRVDSNKSVALLMPYLPNIFIQVDNGSEHSYLMSNYLSICARVLLFSKDIFAQVLDTAAKQCNQTLDSFLNDFLQVWIEKMQMVTHHDKRKLLSLALCSLLTTQSAVVADKFCGILLNVTETLNDIVNTDEQGRLIDSLMIYPETQPGADGVVNNDQNSLIYIQLQREEIFDDDDDSDHERRRRALLKIDPVYNVVLRDYLQAQINILKEQAGDIQYQQIIQTVDIETLQQAREYVSL